MSDSEAFSPPGSITTSKGGRAWQRKIAETQSDTEHGGSRSRHVPPSDTQSEVGFRIYRRSKDDRYVESQSDVEVKVRNRHSNGSLPGSRQRTKVYEDIDGINSQRRISDPPAHSSQLNRNTNAATDARDSPIVAQKSGHHRRSGYGTDPEAERSRRKAQVRSKVRSEVTDDEGYVHPRNYFKLPEYSEKKNPPRTLDLTPLRVKSHTSLGSPQVQGKRHEGTKSMQQVRSQDSGVNLNSPMQGRSQKQHENNPGSNSRHGHSRSRDEIRTQDDARDYVDMGSGSRKPVIKPSPSSPTKSHIPSPTKSHIPSYEEALARHPGTPNLPVRDRQKTPIRNHDDYVQMGIPNPGPHRPNASSPVKEVNITPHRVQPQHRPVDTRQVQENQGPHRPNASSPVKEVNITPHRVQPQHRPVDTRQVQENQGPHRPNASSPVKEVNRTPHRVQPQHRPVDNRQVQEPVRTHRENTQQHNSNPNVANQTKDVALERLLKPLDIGSKGHNALHHGNDRGNRVKDVERDSGNSSNMTCESDQPRIMSSHQEVVERSRGQSGGTELRRSTGINGRKVGLFDLF